MSTKDFSGDLLQIIGMTIEIVSISGSELGTRRKREGLCFFC